MFMDITESILDTKVILSRPTKRHIGSKSRKEIIYRYKKYIHKQFLIHQIYERANEIYSQVEGRNVTMELILNLNTLDK
jgi:hypothetical protein